MSLTTRARADEFARLLDARGRTDDPTLAPLVALAGALGGAAPAVAPRPEFKAALRQRLVAVATVQGVGAPAPSPAARVRELGSSWRLQRRVAIAAGAAAAVTAVAGVGISASRSLPGDAFYGLKRAAESAQLAAAQGEEAKGKRHLEFARTRLAEVRGLVDRGQALPTLVPGAPNAAGIAPRSSETSRITSTLHDMDDETRAGATDLMNVYRASGSVEPLRALDTFTQQQYADLLALLPSLPLQAQSQAKQSLSLLHTVAVDTVTLTRVAGSTGTPQPTPRPDTTSAPTPTSSQGGGTDSSGSPAPSSTAPSSQRQTTPTGVPTIPPLPTSVPVPTEIPTILPTLPDLSSPPPLLPGG